ncbi:MAG: DUF3316 domain-containing protein [Muribaculaceae bacterium]
MSLRSGITALLMCLAAMMAANAQNTAVENEAMTVERPVASSFMIGAGSSSILDTYLSSITNRGWHVRMEYERLQAMRFDPERWIMQLDAGVDYDNVNNPAGNHTTHSLMVDFRWGMMRRFSDVGVRGLQLALGGTTQLRGGAIYKPSNSNNLVSAKIHWSVGITGMASYPVRVLSVPVTLRCQAVLPVAGVFFSPQYGETYYEIYIGNHSGLAHFGWWGNRFDMMGLFTADMHLGRTVLRVGYRTNISTSWVNNLNTHIFTHEAVLGLGGEWLTLSKGKAMNGKSKVISAIY